MKKVLTVVLIVAALYGVYALVLAGSAAKAEHDAAPAERLESLR